MIQFVLWKRASFLINVLLFTLLACSDGEGDFDQAVDGDLTIAYGTSFGECVGYCSVTLQASENELTLIKSGWDEELPTLIYTRSMKSVLWDSLTSALLIENFDTLQSVYGCPDCADGGAEWIEISSNNLEHKVIFEYGNEPEYLKEYVSLLRRLERCFVD